MPGRKNTTKQHEQPCSKPGTERCPADPWRHRFSERMGRMHRQTEAHKRRPHRLRGCAFRDRGQNGAESARRVESRDEGGRSHRETTLQPKTQIPNMQGHTECHHRSSLTIAESLCSPFASCRLALPERPPQQTNTSPQVLLQDLGRRVPRLPGRRSALLRQAPREAVELREDLPIGYALGPNSCEQIRSESGRVAQK